MLLMNYLLGFVLMFMVLGVVVLGMTFVPYQGVIALMGLSFSCCVLMVLLGRTFIALIMYIIYLGGLVVVFGYCVSIEKWGEESSKVNGFSYIVFLITGLVNLYSDFGGLLIYSNLENMVCMEVNGGAVFYCGGGAGLVVCSWGLLVVLFSVLIILGWSRLGGLRPF